VFSLRRREDPRLPRGTGTGYRPLLARFHLCVLYVFSLRLGVKFFSISRQGAKKRRKARKEIQESDQRRRTGRSTGGFAMNRRDFLRTGTTSLAFAAGNYHVFGDDTKKPRVSLIGCGWYGKNDLFRLIQVAPVEVVSLCDVDKKMLAD